MQNNILYFFPTWELEASGYDDKGLSEGVQTVFAIENLILSILKISKFEQKSYLDQISTKWQPLYHETDTIALMFLVRLHF